MGRARRNLAPDDDGTAYDDDGGGHGVVDDAVLEVVATSFLYETAPMYVTDQPAFVNCACLVSWIFVSPASAEGCSHADLVLHWPSVMDR